MRSMIKLASFCILLLLCPHAVGAPIVTVGGYEAVVNQGGSSGIGKDLANPALASTFGVASFVQAPIVAVGGVTTAYLNSIDIFWSGLRYGSPISSTEVATLVNWVNGGGVLIINNDRSFPGGFRQLDPLYAAIGVQLVDQSTPGEIITINNSNHPLTNGPFGAVDNFSLLDAVRFTVLSGDFETLGSWPDGDGAIGILPPSGSRLGTIILLPDYEATGLYYFDAPVGGENTLPDSMNLARNAWAYGVSVSQAEEVPEPASMVIWSLLSVGGLAAWRRRK